MKRTFVFLFFVLSSLSQALAQTAPPIAELVDPSQAQAWIVRSAIRDSFREETMRSWSDGTEHPCTTYDGGGFPRIVACKRPLVVAGRGKQAGQTCISESADNSEFACWPKSCGCYVDMAAYGYGTLCRSDAYVCWGTPVVYASEWRNPAPSHTKRKH